MNKSLGTVLIGIGIIIILFVFYENSKFSKQTRIFSQYSLLTSSWVNYKKQFIKSDGRSVDPSENNVTTSEAQSYAMLRAVWVDDKTTFDTVFNWTQKNMKRPTDNLFGWRYGNLQNGKTGFLPQGGNNSAADADSDIAFALIIASKRWNDPKYLTYAKPIIADIWKHEIASTSGKRYVIAGNWAQDQQKLVINVSYFAPYEWRYFASVDTENNWSSLIDPAYQLLNAVGTASLDKSKGIGLPPDWVAINRSNGQLSAANTSNLTTNYSFDAMRTPWRIALDYQWNKDPQAYNYLKNSYAFLTKEYQTNHTLAQTYSHDGKTVDATEDPAMYATAIGYFLITNKSLADDIYQNKIIRLYSNDQGTFNSNLPYYEQNWLWFGAAIYNNYLTHI